MVAGGEVGKKEVLGKLGWLRTHVFFWVESFL